jgi:hypothetical protein
MSWRRRRGGYQLVVSPRPIAWIIGRGGEKRTRSSISREVNLFNVAGYIPLIRGVGIARHLKEALYVKRNMP